MQAEHQVKVGTLTVGAEFKDCAPGSNTKGVTFTVSANVGKYVYAYSAQLELCDPAEFFCEEVVSVA